MSSFDIIAPDLPESVNDATVAIWHKKVGNRVNRDEVLVEIETDKVMLEVSAAISGILDVIFKNVGATITSGEVLGRLKPTREEFLAEREPEPLPTHKKINNIVYSPSMRRRMIKESIDENTIQVDNFNEAIMKNTAPKDLSNQLGRVDLPKNLCAEEKYSTPVKRVPMTRLRKRISDRLLEVTRNTAMLTTFNEVNMQPIINIRKKYGEYFEKRHGIRLGFMSFYVKSVVEALKRFPEINASIDGEDIIYHNHFDISIAVATPRGLITPVLRHADSLSMASIENNIKDLAEKARNNKLSLEELTGGTFTITNGGVFGSLISTPIINPPQSAILGIHAIKDRPVAVKGNVVILPMTYLALSYDHRLIDGREAISCLVKIKEILEDMTIIILDI
ncbi:dihydrolipoyllysine-residue succinyltransferase [Candidatus Ishikawella capsulata]|uniref:Dihydrolipoyllysine-residue succinyltransferase n=1 Tax=Candidatus Ishikawaella capsulata Mpkobe TaxID=476281 RepID=C5WDC9_9ENTR|nr:dihydrolipoyllysine-residue succinyltransferase [Candidatus Ishikawaella capsulata]BAH83335.1 dihydrolipoamide acetyltransferase [Candidatus Ishikawaella capsulata Mpkobe]